MAPIMLSPPPMLIATELFKPQREASSGRNVPADAREEPTWGNASFRRGSMKSTSGWHHSRLRTSSSAVPEASPYSITMLPVRYQLR